MLSAANGRLIAPLSYSPTRPRKDGHPKSPIVSYGLWYFQVLEVPQKYHSPSGRENRRVGRAFIALLARLPLYCAYRRIFGSILSREFDVHPVTVYSPRCRSDVARRRSIAARGPKRDG